MEQMRITVETEVLEVRADSVEQQILKMRERFQNIGDIVYSSRSYWEGDANDAHCREFAEYQDEIEDVLARFMENVTDLRQIAGIYRQTEAQVESLAEDLPMDILL